MLLTPEKTTMTNLKKKAVENSPKPTKPSKAKKLRYTELEAQVAELSVAKAQAEEKTAELASEMERRESMRKSAAARHTTLQTDKEEKLQQARKDAELIRNVLVDRLLEDEEDEKLDRRIEGLYDKTSESIQADFPDSLEACHKKLTDLRAALAQETLEKSRKTEGLRRARSLIVRLCKMIPTGNHWLGGIPLTLALGGIAMYMMASLYGKMAA